MAKQKIKQISFTDQMLLLADRRTSELGISFPEYIRHLILNDVQSMNSVLMNKKQEKAVNEARQNIEDGDYVVLKGKSEIKKYFSEL